MKFPTGGKSHAQARERLKIIFKVSRSGVIPEPTVKVRMGGGKHVFTSPFLAGVSVFISC